MALRKGRFDIDHDIACMAFRLDYLIRDTIRGILNGAVRYSSYVEQRIQ